MSIWQFLKERLQVYGNNLAIVCGDKAITYNELITLVEDAKTKTSERVCVCDQESKFDQTVEILRCFAKGRVCVPINPEYGAVYLKNIKDELQQGRETVIPKKTACIMFTSGSMGRPKGVMLSHENLRFGLEAILTYFKPKQGERSVVARPLSHIATLMGDLLAPLYCGLQVYFFTEEFSPIRLISFIKCNDISIMNGTPTMFHYIAKMLRGSSDFPLKTAVLSGELLLAETARFIQDKIPECAFYNAYGITEASGRVSVLYPKDFVRRSGAIGASVDGTEIKIINGQIYIKSPGIMVGYYKEPTLTRERLVDGWLNTGDMGYWDESGFLFVDGRADEMIIRAGVKFYPQEIEKVLLKDEQISDCMVYVLQDVAFGQKICINVVKARESGQWDMNRVDERYIMDICQQNLPPHMQPNRIEFVESLPRLSNGKLKRGVL